jgi:hypothetical protein
MKTHLLHIVKLVSELDIIKAVKEGYESDKQFGKIVQEPSHFPNYKLRKGLLYMKAHEREYLCIPDNTINEYHIRTLLILHAHSILSHLGHCKTYLYMHESLWWKNMAKDIESFCWACTICARLKTPTQHLYGLLKPLPVPTLPWSQIGVDFAGPLPLSKTLTGECDMICIVIDHLMAMVHLVPMRQDYTARDIAEVMYSNVYRLHGIPNVIVSDHDKLFTLDYHREIHKLMNTEMKFLSAYHPQMDGMTERMV